MFLKTTSFHWIKNVSIDDCGSGQSVVTSDNLNILFLAQNTFKLLKSYLLTYVFIFLFWLDYQLNGSSTMTSITFLFTLELPNPHSWVDAWAPELGLWCGQITQHCSAPLNSAVAEFEIKTKKGRKFVKIQLDKKFVVKMLDGKKLKWYCKWHFRCVTYW